MPTVIRKQAVGLLRTVVVLAIGLVLDARPSQAQNLVQNPGFETGTTSGWTFTAATGGSDFYVGGNISASFGNGVQVLPHSGSFMAVFGATQGTNDTLAQTFFSTISGQSYDFNFWVNNQDGQNASFLTVMFGAQTVLTINTNSANSIWTDYNFIETATGTSTAISFAGRNVPSWIAIDDVSVTAVPEPSTCAAILGIVSLGFVMLRRRFAQAASSSTRAK